MRNFESYKKHVISQIAKTAVNKDPFYTLVVDDIFPEELYQAIKERVFHYQERSLLQTRRQDNPEFVNARYNLVNCPDVETKYVTALFSDPEIKTELLKKFYLRPDKALEQSLQMHKEYEYVYTGKKRYQNIHVDIPPKFLSLVFYFPEFEVDEATQYRNGTTVYDKKMQPHQIVRYRDNSVCVFAPHFYSYHGFSTTINRASMVIFYVDEKLRLKWNLERDIDSVKKNIRSKLEKHPLIEYGTDPKKLQIEFDACRVNAPLGRVMLTDEEKAVLTPDLLKPGIEQVVAYQE